LATGWKETGKMDEKKEFVFRCRNREETFTEICRKFGTSAKTGGQEAPAETQGKA
jgi:hypothetical protein